MNKYSEIEEHLKNIIISSSTTDNKELFIHLLKYACANNDFKEQIHNELKVYLSQVKNQFTSQFIEKNLDSSLEKLNQLIKIYMDKTIILKNAYHVKLSFDRIMNNHILIKFYDYSKDDVHFIARNNFQKLLVYSIIDKNTIEQYNKARFMALLMIYLIINNYLIDKVENLQTICSKILAEKFSYKHKNPGINIDAIRKLKMWLKLFEEISIIPDNLIELWQQHLNRDMQKILFKKYIHKGIKIVYNTNFTPNVSSIGELKEYIQDIYQIKTIKEWKLFIKKLLELSNFSILMIFKLIDYNFAEQLLSIKMLDNCIKEFKIKTLYEINSAYVNGIYYPVYITYYDAKGDFKNKKIFKYDDNLHIIEEL